MTESVYKIALMRIAAIIPAMALRERLQPGPADEADAASFYIDSKGHRHVIVEMPNGYIHSAAAKLRRELATAHPLAAVTLQAMDAEISRRETARRNEGGDPNPPG